MLQHKKGNLIDLAEAGKFDIIMHGCNCFCTMGSGIAREIRDRYPGAWRSDQCTESGDVRKLGNWTEFDVGNFLIINAYTQYGFNQGSQHHDVFEYTSFELILKKLAQTFPGERFGLPYIGMGLAGGNKERIMAMIEDFANKVSAKGGSVTLVEFGG